MAEAPKPQRRRRQAIGNNNSIASAAPTADATPSGSLTLTRRRPRRRRQRGRRVRIARPISNTGNEIIETNFISRAGMRRSRLTRAIKREIKREGLDGPKVSVQQKITSTFGMIGPNVTGNAELELNFFLHPALAKEANDGTAFGPLQALAAQYSLWKIKYLALRFTPMVGASAVSGTVVRASLNLSQSPGGSNWSGLGTRIHLDMHPGQVATFHLRGDQVGGPRDGGWWFTDTNEEGSQSAGPIVEVHTLGKSMSTFKDKAWDGPLFLVEGIGMWQFANYQVKPALGSLERREADVQAAVTAESGQPITMELPPSSEAALFMDSLEPEAYATPVGNNTVGETIFQIVDVGANLAQTVAPPPFSWLIKGGWWFVKKLLGRTRAGDDSKFVVYASLQDAQNNKPAIATGTVNKKTVPTKLLITQINSPNVGPVPIGPGTARGGNQTLRPDELFRIHSPMISELFINMPNGQPTETQKIAIPVTTIPGIPRNASGTALNQPTSQIAQVSFIQTPWWIGMPGAAPGISTISGDQQYVPGPNRGGYIHSLYRVIKPRFTDRSGEVTYNAPEVGDISGVNFCMLNNFKDSGAVSSSNPYAVYGKVVATSKIHAGTTPPLDMILTLIKTTKSFSADIDSVPQMVMVFGDVVGRAQLTFAPKTTATPPINNWEIVERAIPNDQFLLGVSYTNAPAVIRGVDIPTTLQLMSYSRVESSIAPIFPYNLSGQMFPATSVDAELQYVEYHPPSQDLINQLRDLNVPICESPPCRYEVRGLSPPSADGEGVDPDEFPPDDFSPDSENDSVEDFILALGNEMIDMPRRWLNDPDFNKFLEI